MKENLLKERKKEAPNSCCRGENNNAVTLKTTFNRKVREREREIQTTSESFERAISTAFDCN